MPKKISELPAAAGIADTDELELNQSGVSRKATRGQVIAGLASAAHEHDLDDIIDAGALAALDSVGTAEIHAAAYASAAEAVSGTDHAKLMTALRTAQAIAAQRPADHTHVLADIADAGAVAGLDAIGTAEIDAAAYASQPEAIAGTENSKIMTALRTAEAIVALAPQHQHPLADITDASTLALLDAVGGGEILPNAVTTAKILDGAVDANKLANFAVVTSKLAESAVSSTKLADGAATTAKLADAAVTEAKIAPTAFASHAEATAGTDNTKLMTPVRTAAAIGAQPPATHQHALADIVDAGALAGRNSIGTAEIEPNAVTSGKISAGAVTAAQLADGAVTQAKLSADAVGPDQLQDTSVSPGFYTNASITIDQQGRITAASSGSSDGEANTGSNIGANGIGVFDAKVGVNLQFRNLAPGSGKISVALNGADIELDVVETNLALPATNVMGLATVAITGTLASLSNLDAGGGAFTNYLAAQDDVTGPHTFAQDDSGREKIFTGSMAVIWTVPMLPAGTHSVVHNMGTANLTFAADGVSLKGSTTLAVDRTAALSWLPGNVVKLTGELI